MHPIASEHIRTHPNRSKRVRKLSKTSENVKNCMKTSRKLRDRGANFSDAALGILEKAQARVRFFLSIMRLTHPRSWPLSSLVSSITIQWAAGIVPKDIISTETAAAAAAVAAAATAMAAASAAARPCIPLKISAACPSLEPRRTFSTFSNISSVSGVFECFRTFSDVFS